LDTADGKIDSIRPLADQQFPVVAGGPADVAAAIRAAQGRGAGKRGRLDWWASAWVDWAC